MTIIVQSPEDSVVSIDTVQYAIGLCYFNPETEELIEISEMPDMWFSIEPGGSAIRKLYIVSSPSELINWAELTVIPDDSRSTYSVKIIINEESPIRSDFDILPTFNIARLDSLPQGEFISAYFLIESISNTNEVMSAKIRLSYE